MIRSPKSISITRRMLLGNAAVLALAVLLLAITPVTVSAPVKAAELAVLVAGGVAILAVNVVLMRRALAPLAELSEQMEGLHLQTGAIEPPAAGAQVREVEVLTQALSTMVDRLAEERIQTSRAVLAGQEGERLRVARELHDEVAQGLVAVALMAERCADAADPEYRERFHEIAERVHFYLDEVRRIAHELRPEMLDDLGLQNALIALANGAGDHGLRVERQLANDLPDLSGEQELVIYRVAQEALANAARHAHASGATLTLDVRESDLVLEVADDGRGIQRDEGDGIGIKGMRERARLVDGALEIDDREGGGTRVRLTMPLEGPSR